MHRRNALIPMFVLAACVSLCGCATVDTFTVSDLGNGGNLHSKSIDDMENEQLVLKQPCRYIAGVDIHGELSSGPLQQYDIGIPGSSNTHTKEPIYLVQVGDLAVRGKYDIESFIGVRRNGAFVPNIVLHSDLPGAQPTAVESSPIQFTPKDCHYSIEAGDAA